MTNKFDMRSDEPRFHPFRKSPAMKLGDSYILKAYEWLLELRLRDPKSQGVTARQLQDHLECSRVMVVATKCPRFNDVMRDHGKPHRFRVIEGKGGRYSIPTRWTLRDYTPHQS